MQYQIPPLSDTNKGTIDQSRFGRTGSVYTNPDFFKLYMAQLERSSFDTLFGEEGLNNSIFGSDSSGIFGTTPSSTDPLFGGTGAATTPSDLSSGLSNTGGSQYLEMIARSSLIGKVVEAIDPTTKQKIKGTVDSVLVENGMLLINVGGTKVPPEYLLSISQ